MQVAGLAARLQALDDDALERLVIERDAPLQLTSTFDLAELLLSDASIAQALRWRSSVELAALASGTSTPRLDELLLGTDGRALSQAQRLAADALAEGIPADGALVGGAAASGASVDASSVGDASASHACADRPMGDRHDAEAPVDSTGAPQLALDETIKVGELVHRVGDAAITLRNRAQLPASVARELATAVDADPAELDERLELALLAGLLDRDGGRLRATAVGDVWLASPLPDRWLALAEAWLDAVGDVRAVAASDFPLAGPAELDVRQRQRRQAERLGLAERGSVTTLAAALERDIVDDDRSARDALAAHVPAATASVYLQPDLTAVAPGPLEASVEQRLRRIARVERAGIASQWRLTAQSVAAGLAAGDDADELLAFLAEVSLTGLPQPVAYLVRDTAARFGSLRARALQPPEAGALAQARSDDEQLIRTIAVDRALVGVGVRQTGPHRVTFRVSAETALEALLEQRYPAVLETDAGELVLRRPERAPQRPRERHRLVARLRDAGFEVGAEERAWLERQLQSAVREKVPVRLTVATASDPVDVELVPLAVANGRLRAREANRDVERTLPLSAITRVAGLGAAG